MFQKSTLSNACTGREEYLDKKSLRHQAPRPLPLVEALLSSHLPRELAPCHHGFTWSNTLDDEQRDTIRRGIKTWRAYPWQRQTHLHHICLDAGSSILMNPSLLKDSAETLLCIPSLINDWSIFDLNPQHSFFSSIAHHLPYNPLIFSWGERADDYDLEAYVINRLKPAIEYIVSLTKRPPILLGYCMGGLFALKAAELSLPCRSLVLIATPWDFHQGYDYLALGRFGLWIDPVIETQGYLSADWISLLFALLNPAAMSRKFSRDWSGSTLSNQLFVATEDWLQSGAGLGRAIARQAIWDLFIDNTLVSPLKPNQKSILRTNNISTPSLVIIPTHDRIVPCASASAIDLPNMETLLIQEGHIGLMASEKAPSRSWPKIFRAIENLNASFEQTTSRS